MTRWGCTSARPAARCGPAPTRASAGCASPPTCPRSIRSRAPTRWSGRERSPAVLAAFRPREVGSLNVRIPTPLRSYTANEAKVDVPGETLTELLANLDARYPGIRFRMVDEQ